MATCVTASDCNATQGHICNRHTDTCGCDVSRGLVGERCDEVTAQSVWSIIGQVVPLVLMLANLAYSCYGLYVYHTRLRPPSRLSLCCFVVSSLCFVMRYSFGLNLPAIGKNYAGFDMLVTISEAIGSACWFVGLCSVALLWIEAVEKLGLDDSEAFSPPRGSGAEARSVASEKSDVAPSLLRRLRRGLIFAICVYIALQIVLFVAQFFAAVYTIGVAIHLLFTVAVGFVFRYGARRLRRTYNELYRNLHPESPAAKLAAAAAASEAPPNGVRRLSVSIAAAAQLARSVFIDSPASDLPAGPIGDRHSFIDALVKLIVMTAYRISVCIVFFIISTGAWVGLRASATLFGLRAAWFAVVGIFASTFGVAWLATAYIIAREQLKQEGNATSYPPSTSHSMSTFGGGARKPPGPQRNASDLASACRPSAGDSSPVRGEGEGEERA